MLKKILLATLGTLALGALVVAGVFWDAWRELKAPLSISAPTTLELAPGSAMRANVAEAKSRGWFSNWRQPLYLEALARATGDASRLKAGEYAIEPGLTSEGLIALWVSGRTIQHEIRFIEGTRFDTAMKILLAEPSVAHTLPDGNAETVMAAVGHAGEHPEGRFFPDTYRFSKGTRDVELLKQSFGAMQAELDKAWAGRAADLPYANPMDALIMASIVEKETGVAAERARIAGVFVRRLRTGMKLQTDPTVIYGIGENYDGNIRKADLLTDTPYNTYTRAGLPPTPICLPGRAALEAALHPADGTELYFVSRGDGTHQFSTTIEEHEAAVRQFQLGHGP